MVHRFTWVGRSRSGNRARVAGSLSGAVRPHQAELYNYWGCGKGNVRVLIPTPSRGVVQMNHDGFSGQVVGRAEKGRPAGLSVKRFLGGCLLAFLMGVSS